MVQEMFLHLLKGSAGATYLLDFNFVDIASCFASLVAAEDDRLSNCENSTTSDVLIQLDRTLRYFQFSLLNLHWSKEPYVWSFFLVVFNSHLVCLDQCWETSFLFSCFKHVLGNLFAVILARLSFFL